MNNEQQASNTQEPKKESKQKTLLDATTLFFLSVISYGYLYITEKEYLGHFGIPTTFINFTIPELVPLIERVVLFLISYIFYSFLISLFLAVVSRKLIRVAILIFLVGPFSFLVILYHWGNWGIILVNIIVVALVIFVVSSPSILTFLTNKKHLSKPNNIVIDKMATVSVANKLLDIGFNSIGVKTASFVLLIFFLYYLALNEGKFTAVNKNFYFVAKTTPECVVIYTTPERVICVPFDRNGKKFEPAYRVIYFQENQDIEFRKEQVGPLKPKPTSTQTPIPTFTPTITNTPLPTKTPVPTLKATP